MKTKLFLIATLFISTITYSQTARKGYTYYKNSSDLKMNKGELMEARAKDANNSKKRAARTGRNPQTGKVIKAKHNWVQNDGRSRISKQEAGQTKAKNTRIRPIDAKNEYQNSNGQINRKRIGRSQTIGNYTTIKPNKK